MHKYPEVIFDESSINYCFTNDKDLQSEKLIYNNYKNCVYGKIISAIYSLDELDKSINFHSEELEDAEKKMENANRDMKVF